MDRISVAQLTTRLRFVAQVNISLEEMEETWGPAEVARDDLCEWFSFAFRLSDDKIAQMIRAVEYPPTPGFILSVSPALENREGVEMVIAELGESWRAVTHSPFG